MYAFGRHQLRGETSTCIPRLSWSIHDLKCFLLFILDVLMSSNNFLEAPDGGATSLTSLMFHVVGFPFLSTAAMYWPIRLVTTNSLDPNLTCVPFAKERLVSVCEQVAPHAAARYKQPGNY